MDLDEFNNHLSDFENAVIQGSSKKAHCPFAKTLLIFMVRGMVTHFVFPYALHLSRGVICSNYTRYYQAMF